MNMPFGPEKMQAIVDQAEAGTRDLARLTLSYWNTLVEGGMQREHATLVTAAWIQATIARLSATQ